MAKGKGAKCPHCGKLQFHDQNSHRQCSNCGYIGWSWRQAVGGVGKGKGNYCANCGNQTLHKIVELPGGMAVRRCGVCDFSGIEPAAG
jgi:uncharacterized Zn finger protein